MRKRERENGKRGGKKEENQTPNKPPNHPQKNTPKNPRNWKSKRRWETDNKDGKVGEYRQRGGEREGSNEGEEQERQQGRVTSPAAGTSGKQPGRRARVETRSRAGSGKGAAAGEGENEPGGRGPGGGRAPAGPHCVGAGRALTAPPPAARRPFPSAPRAAPTSPTATSSSWRPAVGGGRRGRPEAQRPGARLGAAQPGPPRSSPSPAERQPPPPGRTWPSSARSERPPPPPSCRSLTPLHQQRHVTELGRLRGIVGALKAAAGCRPPPAAHRCSPPPLRRRARPRRAASSFPPPPGAGRQAAAAASRRGAAASPKNNFPQRSPWDPPIKRAGADAGSSGRVEGRVRGRAGPPALASAGAGQERAGTQQSRCREGCGSWRRAPVAKEESQWGLSPERRRGVFGFSWDFSIVSEKGIWCLFSAEVWKASSQCSLLFLLWVLMMENSPKIKQTSVRTAKAQADGYFRQKVLDKKF